MMCVGTSWRPRRGPIGRSLFAGRSPVYEPDDFADRSYPRRRSLTGAGANRSQDGCLLPPRNQKRDAPAAFNHRERHCDADLTPSMRDHGHPAFAILKHRLARQQRCGMAVGAETEERHIEQWTGRVEDRSPIGLLQDPLITLSCFRRCTVDRDRVNIFGSFEFRVG